MFLQVSQDLKLKHHPYIQERRDLVEFLKVSQQKAVKLNRFLHLLGRIMLVLVVVQVIGLLAGGLAKVATGREMMRLVKINLIDGNLSSMKAILFVKCQNLGTRIPVGTGKMIFTILPAAKGLICPFGLSRQ